MANHFFYYFKTYQDFKYDEDREFHLNFHDFKVHPPQKLSNCGTIQVNFKHQIYSQI